MLNDQMVDAGTVEENLVDFVVMYLMHLKIELKTKSKKYISKKLISSNGCCRHRSRKDHGT